MKVLRNHYIKLIIKEVIMQMSPINIAKDYLANNEQYSHMLDGDFSVTAHDPSLDSHMVNQLDGVEHSDISDNEYHVVTVQKNVSVEGEGNFTIPKIVKVQVNTNNNTVQSVLESK